MHSLHIDPNSAYKNGPEPVSRALCVLLGPDTVGASTMYQYDGPVIWVIMREGEREIVYTYIWILHIHIYLHSIYIYIHTYILDICTLYMYT